MSESVEIYRQIDPLLVFDGKIGSDNFKPLPKDDGKLSVDDANIFDAQTSYETAINRGLRTCGCFGIANSDLTSTNRSWSSDPIQPSDGDIGNIAHAIIPFDDLGNNQRKKIAEKLRDFSVSRGCLYNPDSHENSANAGLTASM